MFAGILDTHLCLVQGSLKAISLQKFCRKDVVKNIYGLMLYLVLKKIFFLICFLESFKKLWHHPSSVAMAASTGFKISIRLACSDNSNHFLCQFAFSLNKQIIVLFRGYLGYFSIIFTNYFYLRFLFLHLKLQIIYHHVKIKPVC